MGQQTSRTQKVVEEGGSECVREVDPRPPVPPGDHKAELHPRPDETPVAVVEGGGGQEEKGGQKTRKKRRFKRLASFFRCFSRRKSTRARNEQVERAEVDQDAKAGPSTDGQASVQDVVCIVEDDDHQKPPTSSPEVCFSAEDQQMKDNEPQDQDSPVSPSAGASGSHLLRRLDCTLCEIIKTKTVLIEHICWKYAVGKKMGKGGFGSVFEGTRCKDGLQVAMKFVEKTENVRYVSLPDHPRPVPLEVALTAMANQGPDSSNIIKLLDWQDQLEQYIMVLERPSPCVDMHLFWKDHGKLLSEGVARHFMRQIVDAAAACCSRGVFHRDIKMPNLLVNTETLEVKLIDFGCGDLLKSSSYNTYSGM
ncbi:serine/threonine-protein kinase pim-2-like [Puntigrus tetrazona]|uniref:serine/threonine-protein kinase pim-2-like n=1 Tax=Puntigrus tetrazona TaxID=1606681 RepID=UPI001C8AACD2|nr:serine/threonine-protein kinase pim-2-like [Puntigrus tetrazona]